MTSSADVGVVIPARHAESTLAAAVESAVSEGVAAIIIAVDPADIPTHHRAQDLAVRYPCVRLASTAAGATPVALNRGIALLDTAVVARLDAHARFDRGYIVAALDALDATGAAVVGGRQRAVGVSSLGRAVAAAMASRAGSGDARHRVGGQAGPTETAYLGVFHRRWIDQVGGYDEHLARNQDYEICHRIRLAGGKVWFVPSMSATYAPRETWRALIGQYHDFGRWKRRVMRDDPRSIRPRQLAPPLLVVGLLASAGAGLLRRGRNLGMPEMLLPATYTVAVSMAAARATATAPPPLSWTERVRVVAALAVMHTAWGVGFWRGGRGQKTQDPFADPRHAGPGRSSRSA